MKMNDDELQAAMDRSTGQRISSFDDLKCWVDCHISDDANAGDIFMATDAIAHMDHPAWGDDWTAFLSGIDLVTLY